VSYTKLFNFHFKYYAHFITPAQETRESPENNVLNLKSIMRKRFFDWVSALVTLIYGLSFCLINIARFRQFQTFYYDFGIFSRSIFQLSRFKTPIIDHYTFGLVNQFADHFNPGIIFLVPFFWLTTNPEILLITQVIAVALSGWAIYLTSKTVTKNHLFSFGIFSAYLLFLGLQNAIIAAFHPEVVALLPLSLSLLFLVKRKILFFFVTLIIGFAFKESIPTFGLFLGIFLVFKRQFKLGAITALISLAWLMITTKVLIPFISPGNHYFYTPHYPLNPFRLITNVLGDPQERKTIFLSLASFSFLPLLSPPAWALTFGDFMARFATDSSAFAHKQLTMHYSALAALGLAFSSIQAYTTIKRLSLKIVPFLGVILVIFSLVLASRPVLNSPINLVYNLNFFRSIKNHQETETILNLVPKTGTLMTQNSLAVRFPDRKVFLLRQEYPCYQPHHLLINAEAGQNPNNFWQLNYDQTTQMINQLKEDQDYRLDNQLGERYLFSRTAEREGDFSHEGINQCTAALKSQPAIP